MLPIRCRHRRSRATSIIHRDKEDRCFFKLNLGVKHPFSEDVLIRNGGKRNNMAWAIFVDRLRKEKLLEINARHRRYLSMDI